MDSQLLRTPGRSRFSKALPLPPPRPPPPPSPTPTEKSQSQGLKPSSLYTPLPPLPKEKTSAMAIPRRPVGGDSTSKSASSVSSMYSNKPSFSRSLSNSSQKTKVSLGAVATTAESNNPPVPPKDNRGDKTPLASNTTIVSSILTINHSSPRPELWRRRSLKTAKGVEFPELNLTDSNGSTASTPPIQKEQPPILSHLPRSQGARKPVPVRDAPPQPQPNLMGSKLSKPKNHDAPVEEHTSNSAATATTGLSRLPTPEYQKTDVQQIVPKVRSPISPETPPNEVENALPHSDNQLPVIQNPPRRSDLRPRVESTGAALGDNLRPAIPSGGSDSPIRLDSHGNTHTRTANDTLTISDTFSISFDAPVSSPQPKKPIARILTQQRSPSPIQTPATLPPSPRSGYNGHPPFPLLPSPRAAPGTVMPALELDITHLECYQSHKHMRSSRNALCPVACMVCCKSDAEQRWRCVWCSLSACGSCMKTLTSIPGKDLRVCLAQIKRSGLPH